MMLVHRYRLNYVLIWSLCPYMVIMSICGHYVLIWPLCPHMAIMSLYGHYVLTYVSYNQ